MNNFQNIPDNELFDPSENMLAASIDKRVYHRVYLSAEYAVNLVANGTPQCLTRAENVVRAVLECQELDKKNPHYGIDIAASFKNNIKATQEGIVILSDEIKSLGHTVIIAHPNNYYSIYGHMHKRLCKARDFITIGQTIGLVGQANNEEGPHLHFEIWHNNLIIDPRNLIKDYKINDVSIKK